jgi:hypothetical protein
LLPAREVVHLQFDPAQPRQIAVRDVRDPHRSPLSPAQSCETMRL